MIFQDVIFLRNVPTSRNEPTFRNELSFVTDPCARLYGRSIVWQDFLSSELCILVGKDFREQHSRGWTRPEAGFTQFLIPINIHYWVHFQ